MTILNEEILNIFEDAIRCEEEAKILSTFEHGANALGGDGYTSLSKEFKLRALARTALTKSRELVLSRTHISRLERAPISNDVKQCKEAIEKYQAALEAYDAALEERSSKRQP